MDFSFYFLWHDFKWILAFYFLWHDFKLNLTIEGWEYQLQAYQISKRKSKEGVFRMEDL